MGLGVFCTKLTNYSKKIQGFYAFKIEYLQLNTKVTIYLNSTLLYSIMRLKLLCLQKQIDQYFMELSFTILIVLFQAKMSDFSNFDDFLMAEQALCSTLVSAEYIYFLLKPISKYLSLPGPGPHTASSGSLTLS